MSSSKRTSRRGSLIEDFFLAANVASVVTVLVFGVFYVGFLLTHETYLNAIQNAIINVEFKELQQAIEAVTAGILGVTGWVRLGIGLGLILMSFFFIVNTGGIVFSVFIHQSFSAGGTPTVRWWRMSLSKFWLSLRLIFFIALYKVTGIQGFSMVQEFLPNNPILNVGFFLNSALSLGTLIVLTGVIKVVVYETARYETLVEENRSRVSDALEEYLQRMDDDMILLEEAMLSHDENGYVRAKLEDATRNMKANRHLVERSYHDLRRLSSPNVIIQKIFFTFIGVIIIQVFTDILFFIGWGTILDTIIRFIGLG